MDFITASIHNKADIPSSIVQNGSSTLPRIKSTKWSSCESNGNFSASRLSSDSWIGFVHDESSWWNSVMSGTERVPLDPNIRYTPASSLCFGIVGFSPVPFSKLNGETTLSEQINVPVIPLSNLMVKAAPSSVEWPSAVVIVQHRFCGFDQTYTVTSPNRGLN